MILCPDCDPSILPLIQPITEWIKEDGAVQWYDIATFERTVTAVYEKEIYIMPIDADVLHLVYRTDVLAKVGWNRAPST